MDRHEALYDFIVDAVTKAHPDQPTLDTVLTGADAEGLSGGWQIPRAAMTNALHLRGVRLASGILALDQERPDNFVPVITDFEAFTAAAVRVIYEATAPLSAIEVISMAGSTSDAIPSGSLAALLKPHGIHLLPGVGFWASSQYVDEAGRIVTAKSQSDAVKAILGYFERHGWPVVGSMVEEATEGEATSRYISRLVAKGDSDAVTGIGSGMYVPYALRDQKPLPISPNVAAAVLAAEGEAIDDKDHLRLFRLALILERHQLATLKLSRTTRGGLRRQTARIVLTDEAREWLATASRKPRDEY